MTFGWLCNDIYIKFNKVQFINFTNNILKKSGENISLSIEDSWIQIKEVADILEDKKFNPMDLINKEKLSYPYILGEKIRFDFDKSKKENSVMILSIDFNSEDEIIVKIFDNMPEGNNYSWLGVIYNIECKECIVDDVGCEYDRFFQFIWYEGTHIIKKEGNNFHYDYFSAEDYDKLIEGNIYPIHFGMLRLDMIYNQLFNLKIEIEGLEEGEHYTKLCTKIDKKKNEIKVMEMGLSKIFGIEYNDNYMETLTKMQWKDIKHNYLKYEEINN